MLTFYGYDRCSTCRNAKKWLDAHGHRYRFVDITRQPPPKPLLQRIAHSDAYSLRSLFNTAGQRYRELDLKTRLPHMSESDALDLLATYGKLVKRPLVVEGDASGGSGGAGASGGSGGERFTVGFKPEVYEQVWGRP
ncbi:MAG: Spx/MgsR family RNA polymerase-binding regulatory protein [Phycisphaeraceae bacterium]